MNNLRSFAILFAITLTITCLAGCSSRQSQGEPTSNAAAKPAAATPPAPPEPALKVSAAWKLSKVVMITESLPGSPGMKYSITPKPGLQIVAVELILSHEDAAQPISANYSEIALIDSKGERHKPLFSYPSVFTTYKPGGDSVSFDDKGTQPTKLSEAGGKLIAVVEAPAGERAFEIAIGAAQPVHIDLNAK